MIKTYEAIFEPGKTTGVYGISLVENPAMQGHFIALSEEVKEIQLKTLNEEERILIGLVLEPNKPIYRKQEGEEFNIVFSENTIKELSYEFYKGGFHSNSSLEHKNKITGVTFVESWIIEDSKNDKSNALGLSYPKGSWIATMKVDSEDIWNDYVKTGKVKGFSIDALISLKEINLKSDIKMSNEKTLIEKITGAIELGFSSVVKSFGLGSVKTSDDNVDIQFEGETLEAGVRVWIIAEDKTEVPLPAGSYNLADNRVLVVVEDGKAAEIKEAAPAETAKPAEQQPAEMTAKQTDEAAKAIENAIKSIMIKYSEEVDKKLDKKFEAMDAKLNEKLVEFSEKPSRKPVKATPEQVAPTTVKGRILEAIQNQ